MLNENKFIQDPWLTFIFSAQCLMMVIIWKYESICVYWL